MVKVRVWVTAFAIAWAVSTVFRAAGGPADQGVRAVPDDDEGLRVRAAAEAGAPLDGLTATQLAAFRAGAVDFIEARSVSGGLPNAAEAGLGPTFNLDSCGGCHAAPNIGGSSPETNPQVALATLHGATNRVPEFVTVNGPVRVAHFVERRDGRPDGGVHALFTIAGRSDAPGCRLSQPDFGAEAAHHNLALRIPTPLFGAGLVENIPDAAILANRDADHERKLELGIMGHENRNGHDGSIARFGWKAQNPSLMLFAGEAYNVEMGVTNEVFPTERDQTPHCQLNGTPEDHVDFAGGASGVQHFTDFMRFLGAPAPKADTPAAVRGRAAFSSVGCSLCHTPMFVTAPSNVAALSTKTVTLYSDLLVHDMGAGLADRVAQGAAGGAEFRTAPLWGLGQRLFFLHDGRTYDLVNAIQAHRSPGSEANLVIDALDRLPPSLQQDLLSFLRSL